jgi:hypothetical protein
MSLSNHFAYRRSAVWTVTGVCVFVLGWRLCLLAAQYLGGHTVTRELEGVLQFEQDLSPNGANTRLVFCQDTENGVGVYFCNTAGGKPKLLCEQKEKGHSWKRFTMLGWSPDDSLFAVAFPDAASDKEMILVFNGNTGEPAGKVGAEDHLEQLAWLSNDSFAYCTRTDVGLVASVGKDRWQHQHFFTGVGTNIDSFTAVSANSVAWQDSGAVWLFDLNTGATKKIWQGQYRYNLADFTYSKTLDEYLLNLRDGQGQYLVRYSAVQTNSVNLGHIGPWMAYVQHATWDGQGTAYTYLTNELGVSVLCLKTPDAAAPVNVPWHGGAASLILNGQHAYFQGNGDGQSPGIWDYDLKSQSSRLVISASDDPMKKMLGQMPTFGTFTDALREQRFYHLWAPTHVVPGRKYPVLLAQELNNWFPYFQMAADNGFYVAVVDRPFSQVWNEPHERTWNEDVSALYQIMAENPNVDTNRMFLYACSYETRFLSAAMQQNPELWKGAIMVTPIQLPERPLLSGKSLLVVDGQVDGDMATTLPKFQDETARQSGVVTLYIQNNAGHDAAAGVTERTRAKAFVNFLAGAH